MNTSELNINLVENYFALLKNLSSENKLKLIEKLSTLIGEIPADKKSTFKKSFGAFKSDKSAEETISEIRNSRTFNREIEMF